MIPPQTIAHGLPLIRECPFDPAFQLGMALSQSYRANSKFLDSITWQVLIYVLRGGAGKTQCINHFIINNTWYLVDLPGYG